MAKISEKDVNKFLDYIGISKSSKNKEQNLYKILGIIPEVDDEGNRLPTPYEILQTPPQFRDGKEVPIIFAIKNRAKKIGKYLGSEKLFYYINKKVKDEASLDGTLEELKKKYKHAIFIGNAEQALSYLEFLESLTGSQIEEIMGSYYNYAMFYKRMKKQLMMDMFAHFFLTYFFRYRNNIREGLLKKSGHFKPYFEKNSLTLSGNELNQISQANVFANSSQVDFSGIKSIKFENMDMDFDDTPSFSVPTQTVTEMPKPEIPNIIAKPDSAKSESINIETASKNEPVSEKPEASNVAPVQEEQNESDKDFEERKSFVKIPKSVKSKFYDIPEFSKNKIDAELETEQNQPEDTKSFNWG